MTQQWQKIVQEKISRRGFMRGLSALGAGAAMRTVVPAGVLAAATPALVAAAQGAGVAFTPLTPAVPTM